MIFKPGFAAVVNPAGAAPLLAAALEAAAAIPASILPPAGGTLADAGTTGATLPVARAVGTTLSAAGAGTLLAAGVVILIGDCL